MKNRQIILITTALIFFVAVTYSTYWYVTASNVAARYKELMKDHTLYAGTTYPAEPKIAGFPGPMKLLIEHDIWQNDDMVIEFSNLRVEGWPFLSAPFHVSAGPLSLTLRKVPLNLPFDSLDGHLRYLDHSLNMTDVALIKDELNITVSGIAAIENSPPVLDIVLGLKNYQPFLASLIEAQIIKPKAAMFINAGLGVFTDETGQVTIPVTLQKNGRIFAGPIPLGKIN